MAGKSTPARQEDPHLVAALKDAIATSGEKLAQIARATGVSTGQLSRFVRGERDLSLGAASKLVDYFGFKLVRSKARGK